MFDIHATSAAAYTVSIDADGFRFSDINEGISRISGIPYDDYVGKRPHELFPNELADQLVGRYRHCAATRQAVSYEIEYVLPSGYVCWRSTIVPMLSPETGAVVSFAGLCVDITAAKMVERASLGFDEKLSAAIGAIEGGFWVYDVATGSFETSRPLAELIAGPGHETLSLAEYAGFVHAEDLGRKLLMSADVSPCVEYRIVTHDGRTRWLESKRRTITDANGTVTRIVGLVLDVTAQKNALRALEREVSTDTLTGLKNRRAFDRIAARRFRETRRTREPLGLVLINLDAFKPINDRHGHRAGDELLRRVARRLADLVAPADIVARICGVEFAILTRATGLGALASAIEDAFAKPFRLGAERLPIAASLGVAAQCELDRSVEMLFERADRALARASATGASRDLVA